jgi:hypothetical protein
MEIPASHLAKMADNSEVRKDDTCDKVRSADLSRVKNKIRRTILYKQEKHNKNKEKRDRKKKRKREEEELGDEVLALPCCLYCIKCTCDLCIGFLYCQMIGIGISRCHCYKPLVSSVCVFPMTFCEVKMLYC